jgi:hypothetical protein
MNKLVNTIERLKISARPGRKRKLKDQCTIYQAIIDRRLANEASNKLPSYTEQLNFYSLFIPNLVSDMRKYSGIPIVDRAKILDDKINAYIAEVIYECSKYITVFLEGKVHIINKLPEPAGTRRRSTRRK